MAPEERLSNFVQRAWRGEAAFWPVCYVFGVFGTAVVLVIWKYLLPAIYDTTLLEWVGLVLIGAYVTWTGALLWRCASNVGGFGIYHTAFVGFAWFACGLVLLAVAIWVGLAAFGLPVVLQ